MADKRKSPRRRKVATPQQRTLGINLLTAGAAAIGLGAATLAILFARRNRPDPAEHAAPDLALDRPHPGPHDRAPDAFRPDPTAPVPPELRESLRPATGPAPGFAADRGTTIQ
jgi:hypothetical protein